LPGIRLARYLVPYFLYIYDTIPFDEHYRRIEQRAIRRRLPALIEAERPDVVVAGQEPLAWYVPQIAREHSLPCVQLLRGTPTDPHSRRGVRAAQDVRHVARERAPVAVRDRRESAAKAPARLRGLPLRYPDPRIQPRRMLGWPR
jgi:hypothetical protein